LPVAGATEIQKADAVRLYGQQAIWKEVGQRLLNNTCQSRTGRYDCRAAIRVTVERQSG